MPRGVNRYDEARHQRRLWTPRHLGSGLEGLYSLADLTVGSYPDGAGAVVSSGTVTLPDRSGKGRNLISNGTDALPAYSRRGLVNQPAALFTGPEALATSAFSLSLPFGFVTLFQTASSIQSFAVLLDDPVGPNQIGFYTQNAGVPRLYAGVGSGLAMTAGAQPLAVSTTYIAAGLFNGVSSSASINGADWQIGNAGPANMTGGFVVSVNGANVQFTGAVADIIWISNATLDNLRRLEGWVAWRAGLQESTLAYNHPYRNRPPLIGC